MINEARLNEIRKQLKEFCLGRSHHVAALELMAEFMALAGCKFFRLNPNYPLTSGKLYSKCTRLSGHTGACE